MGQRLDDPLIRLGRAGRVSFSTQPLTRPFTRRAGKLPNDRQHPKRRFFDETCADEGLTQLFTRPATEEKATSPFRGLSLPCFIAGMATAHTTRCLTSLQRVTGEPAPLRAGAATEQGASTDPSLSN